MKQPDDTQMADATKYPVHWDEEELHQRWSDLLISISKEEQISLPLKRIQYQVQHDPTYRELIRRWPRMNADERLAAWKSLIHLSENAIRQILPTCVACGECCRTGSPTLHVEDLELLQQGRIPWGEVFTLRRGEPVRSPFHQKLIFLDEEKIKIRERSGSQECLYLEVGTDKCLIYTHRPLQCRAQACWDPKMATGLEKTPYLTRLEVFKGVDLLLDLIEEHDRRCSFEKLQDAFEQLRETRGETVDEVLQLLSYEDHFRHFLGRQLHIPEENLDLVFGRSFADMVQLFGFKVVTDPDGSRCLVVDE